ncbi:MULTISPECIES: helix-turn-helix domain-containing protein [Lactobacillaceae]|uniref:helix-turn-helix domain-containing protein n=1 Tax=Lactobacillaceae TaxID=33958 RepID=UPI00227BFCC8|nr:helix-turn-helix transcriptional regulator [Lactobacillus porci]
MNQEQTNITTGKQIRHLRTQLGMTQEELAGELNVTRQALSNWERDVNEPDLNMWQIAINKLNTSSKHFSHKDFNG